VRRIGSFGGNRGWMVKGWEWDLLAIGKYGKWKGSSCPLQNDMLATGHLGERAGIMYQKPLTLPIVKSMKYRCAAADYKTAKHCHWPSGR